MSSSYDRDVLRESIRRIDREIDSYLVREPDLAAMYRLHSPGLGPEATRTNRSGWLSKLHGLERRKAAMERVLNNARLRGPPSSGGSVA